MIWHNMRPTNSAKEQCIAANQVILPIIGEHLPVFGLIRG